MAKVSRSITFYSIHLLSGDKSWQQLIEESGLNWQDSEKENVSNFSIFVKSLVAHLKKESIDGSSAPIKINHLSREYEVLRTEVSGFQLKMEVSAVTPEDTVTIKNNLTNDYDEVEAPDDNEFLDGQLFVSFVSDYCSVLTSNCHVNRINDIIEALMERCNIDPNNARFGLLPVHNKDKLAIIKSEKIDSIELRGTSKKANIEKHDPALQKALKKTAEYVKELMLDENNVEQEYATGNRVKIKIERNKLIDSPIEADEMMKLALNTIENEEEEFIIRTEKNTVIRSNEVTLKATNSYNFEGKRLSSFEVWRSIENFRKVTLKNDHK